MVVVLAVGLWAGDPMLETEGGTGQYGIRPQRTGRVFVPGNNTASGIPP